MVIFEGFFVDKVLGRMAGNLRPPVYRQAHGNMKNTRAQGNGRRIYRAQDSTVLVNLRKREVVSHPTTVLGEAKCF